MGFADLPGKTLKFPLEDYQLLVVPFILLNVYTIKVENQHLSTCGAFAQQKLSDLADAAPHDLPRCRSRISARSAPRSIESLSTSLAHHLPRIRTRKDRG